MKKEKKKKKTFRKNPDVIAILGFNIQPFVHRRHTTSKSVSLSNRNSAYVFLFTTRGISSTVDSCSAKKFKLRALCETLTRLRQSPQMNQKWVGLLLLSRGGEEEKARWPQKKSGRREREGWKEIRPDSIKKFIRLLYGRKVFSKRPLARKVQFYGKWLTSDKPRYHCFFHCPAIGHVFTFETSITIRNHHWRLTRTILIETRGSWKRNILIRTLESIHIYIYFFYTPTFPNIWIPRRLKQERWINSSEDSIFADIIHCAKKIPHFLTYTTPIFIRNRCLKNIPRDYSCS